MSLYGIILESVIAAVQIKSRPPTNHATAEGPVRPCGPVRFSVADAAYPTKHCIFSARCFTVNLTTCYYDCDIYDHRAEIQGTGSRSVIN